MQWLTRLSGRMSGYEKRSAIVGAGLLLALAVTYCLLFGEVGQNDRGLLRLSVLLGLAYITGYARIIIPRRQGVTTFNIREASYSLLLIGGEPRLVIPALVALRVHQWWLTGNTTKWRLLTAATGLETILVQTWVFHHFGLLGAPDNVTLPVVLEAAPYLAASALLSFGVFSLVHPARSVKATAKLVPPRVIVGVCALSWAASLLGMLFFVPEIDGARRTIASFGPFLLLGLAAAVNLKQFNRAQQWSQASRLIGSWDMSASQVLQLVQRIHRLSPRAAQILLVEDRSSGKTFRAWTSTFGMRSSVEVLEGTLEEVLVDYPESGNQVRRGDPWNHPGAVGWLTSDTSRPGIALLQIAPRVQVPVLPAIPQGTTYLTLPAEALLDQLARAARLHEAARVAGNGLPGTLRNLTEGFATVGGDGRIKSWNRALERLTGISEGDAVGGTIEDHFETTQVVGADDNRPLLSLQHPDGALLLIHATVSTVESHIGRDTVYTFRDVTETVAMVESRNQFLAFVAHELKSPLMTLHLQADELEDRLGPDDDLVNGFNAVLTQLTSYLADMSTASEMGTSHTTLTSSSHSVPGRRVLEFPWLDKTREVYERIEIVESARFRVVADLLRSRQVLTNIVSNALKYSPHESPILIEFGVDADNVFGYYQVTDRGIGIPSGDRDRVFEPYFRARNSGRGSGGGLGLALSHNLARQMGGDLRYEPNPGGGSIFTFYVPLARSEAQDEIPSEAHADA